MPARSGRKEVSQPKVSTSIPLVLPELHPGQKKIAAEAKQFNVPVMGRRWGKSFFARDRLIHPMLKGLPVAWFAPTNKILADSWREMQNALIPITKKKSEDEHRIEIIGGGSVEMWSLESQDAGRSRKYARVVVDEAAMVAKLEQFWMENILPTLTDFNGDAWLLSTPRGFNYYKKLFDYGQDPNKKDWMSWQLPTYTNPHIPASFLDNVKSEMTEAAFNQEYLAMFINWEGSVFRNIVECCTGKPEDGPTEGHDYIIGVDWGRSRDYTVFTVIDRTARRVVAMDRSNKVDYSLQRGRLAILRDRWKPVEIVAEQNNVGVPIIEQLRKDGIRIRPFETSNASKNRIIEHLALAFERQQIIALDDPLIIGEFQAFQSEQLPSGMIRYGAALGHDDIVMSLALGWSEVANPVSLGLLDMYKEDISKAEAAKMNKLEVANNTLSCPECHSPSVVKVMGQMKCNQCGLQFGGGPCNPNSAFNRNTISKYGNMGNGW